MKTSDFVIYHSRICACGEFFYMNYADGIEDATRKVEDASRNGLNIKVCDRCGKRVQKTKAMIFKCGSKEESEYRENIYKQKKINYKEVFDESKPLDEIQHIGREIYNMNARVIKISRRKNNKCRWNTMKLSFDEVLKIAKIIKDSTSESK